MIKIPKRPSYNYQKYLCAIEKYPPFKITVYILISLALYFFFPIFLAFSIKQAPIGILTLFYLTNIVLITYLFKKHSKKAHNFAAKIEGLQGQINLLKSENNNEIKNKAARQEKIKRYSGLKEIIEDINRNLDLDSITGNLISIAFSAIAGNKGTCILYLVDNQTQRLNIYKSKKEDKGLVIKSKEGDIFDTWVSRHANPLLIEDIKKDFRFDSEQIRLQSTRPIESLISAPFLSDHNFLGMLRLDNEKAGFYSQDDLRFLVSLCELGAVALENGQLFQKTQILATHDGLTAFYRKSYFLERLEEECKRSGRKKLELSLLMIDIDYFKKYNDQFGHSAGDIVLKGLSQSITTFLKKKATLAGRFGGEEFCVVLLDTGKEEALSLAEQLRLAIGRNKVILRRQETVVTVSIGVSSFPADANDGVELILKADKAMYTAKQKGRNRVVGV